jgi:copper homeostasis protein
LKTYHLEACVENASEALTAQHAGAEQIELCSRLDLDGLTPDLAQIRKSQEILHIPIKVMIRPRGGDFVYSSQEQISMIDQIKRLQYEGVERFVIGMLTKHGDIDFDFLEKCASYCSTEKLCFHKAIDATTDIIAATTGLVASGLVASILTSGGADTAWHGRYNLLKMKEIASDKLDIIAAGSIRYDNLAEHHAVLGLSYYHGRRIVPL